ncbi:PBPRA1643 family SWIM/SEC-C metal-binding motif protein [Neptunicella sp. SCSIO 80796]|uniref:PBPRA1643 family SWIM/SEC-C metal-binding motif protein n=1 Tax=Neptunicella plasticusilytica TaxID=3117012 RepID=UPI003A4D667D
MSKFFFKGRIDAREQYQRFGYKPKRNIKPGTEESPLNLTVNNEERKTAVEVLLKEHGLCANIQINSDAEEDLHELDVMLRRPKTTTFDKTPKRNDPCHCGSGKKYKKCCSAQLA